MTLGEITLIQAGLDEMPRKSADNVLGVVTPFLVPEYGRCTYCLFFVWFRLYLGFNFGRLPT